MTRKDYIQLAAVFAENRPKRESLERDTPEGTLWVQLRDDIVRVLENDNPRFNPFRFYKATEE